VLLHHEYIDPRQFDRPGPSLREVERMRRELDIPSEAAVVMGAGTVEWRKGPDLFVQVAAEVRRRTRDPVSFVWVGGHLEGSDWERIRSDIERAGADHVRFLGFKPDPHRWFRLADVFALTSHEDPFPLVCLEHALLRHPVVTYRNGGMVELLEAAGPEAATGVVDHLDVGAFADRVIAFLESDRLRIAAGEQLERRVREHHTTETSVPQLLEDLERVAASTSA
jgi:glycosyltransferase involved in cell wall biosynthesis